ncbi:thioesterase II family protein, partial [Telmatospirillum siberiense]
PEAPPLHRLDDEALRAAAMERFALPAEFLEHEDLWRVVLPTLRADIELLETWRPAPEAPLDLPLTIVGARQDRIVALSQLTDWAARTTAALSLHILDGGHMLPRDQGPALLEILRRILGRHAEGGAS